MLTGTCHRGAARHLRSAQRAAGWAICWAGANPKARGTGWDPAWNTSLEPDTAALEAALKCNPSSQTWTDSPAGNEKRPIGCITWYEAFAFCVWDGGRLLTEAEWNYAAAAGSEQRQYPWSIPPMSITVDETYAVYCTGSCKSARDVGSKSPKGDGKWGHADLGGNAEEWVFDWSSMGYPLPCSDCANTTKATYKAGHGGAFPLDSSIMLTYWRVGAPPDNRASWMGARCARGP